MSRYQLRRTGDFSTPGGANIIQLDQDCVKFGRNPEQVQVVLHSTHYSNMISREHADIRRQRNHDSTTAYFLIDKSLNGTYVNDFRVRGNTLLHPGDVIKFGHINGAAIQPGVHAPQANAEFAYIFEKVPRNNASNLPPSMASLQQHQNSNSQSSCNQSATPGGGYSFPNSGSAAAAQYSQTFGQNPYANHPMAAQQQVRLAAAAGAYQAYPGTAAAGHPAFGGFNPYHAGFFHPAYAALYGQHQRAAGFPGASSQNLTPNLTHWAATGASPHAAAAAYSGLAPASTGDKILTYSGLAAGGQAAAAAQLSSVAQMSTSSSSFQQPGRNITSYVGGNSKTACALSSSAGSGSDTREQLTADARTAAGMSELMAFEQLINKTPFTNHTPHHTSSSMTSIANQQAAVAHAQKIAGIQMSSTNSSSATAFNSAALANSINSGGSKIPAPGSSSSDPPRIPSSSGVIMGNPMGNTSGASATLAAVLNSAEMNSRTLVGDVKMAECDSSVPSPPKHTLRPPALLTKTAQDEDSGLSQELRELAASATNRFAYNNDSPDNIFGVESPEPVKKEEEEEEEDERKSEDEEKGTASPPPPQNEDPPKTPDIDKETKESSRERSLSPATKLRLAVAMEWKPRRKSNEVSRLLNDLTEGSFHHQAARASRQQKKQGDSKGKKKKGKTTSPSKPTKPPPTTNDTERERCSPSPSNSSTSGSSGVESPAQSGPLTSPHSDTPNLSPQSRERDKSSPIKKRKGFRSPIAPSSPKDPNTSTASRSDGEKEEGEPVEKKTRTAKSSSRFAYNNKSPTRSPTRKAAALAKRLGSGITPVGNTKGRPLKKRNATKLKVQLRNPTPFTSSTAKIISKRPKRAAALFSPPKPTPTTPKVSHKKKEPSVVTPGGAKRGRKPGSGKAKEKTKAKEEGNTTEGPKLLGLDQSIDHWHWHDPYQPCDAKIKCKKPQEDNVDWVQCNDCGGWFHLMCTNSKIDLDDEDAVFQCNVCVS